MQKIDEPDNFETDNSKYLKWIIYAIIFIAIIIFKEVAKEFAYYFENTNEANVLCKAIKEWLELYKDDKHPKSQNMPWLTWQESTKILLDKIII